MAAFSMSLDGLRRCADDGVALTAEQRFELFVAARRNRFRAQSRDARRVQFFDDEFDQRVVEAAVADKADFFSGQLRALLDARPADYELLIDAAGEKHQVCFAFKICSKRRRRRQVAELNFSRHQAAYDALCPTHDLRSLDGETMLVKQSGFPGDH